MYLSDFFLFLPFEQTNVEYNERYIDANKIDASLCETNCNNCNNCNKTNFSRKNLPNGMFFAIFAVAFPKREWIVSFFVIICISKQ